MAGVIFSGEMIELGAEEFEFLGAEWDEIGDTRGIGVFTDEEIEAWEADEMLDRPPVYDMAGMVLEGANGPEKALESIIGDAVEQLMEYYVGNDTPLAWTRRAAWQAMTKGPHAYKHRRGESWKDVWNRTPIGPVTPGLMKQGKWMITEMPWEVSHIMGQIYDKLSLRWDNEAGDPYINTWLYNEYAKAGRVIEYDGNKSIVNRIIDYYFKDESQNYVTPDDPIAKKK